VKLVQAVYARRSRNLTSTLYRSTDLTFRIYSYQLACCLILAGVKE